MMPDWEDVLKFFRDVFTTAIVEKILGVAIGALIGAALGGATERGIAPEIGGAIGAIVGFVTAMLVVRSRIKNAKKPPQITLYQHIIHSYDSEHKLRRVREKRRVKNMTSDNMESVRVGIGPVGPDLPIYVSTDTQKIDAARQAKRPYGVIMAIDSGTINYREQDRDPMTHDILFDFNFDYPLPGHKRQEEHFIFETTYYGESHYYKRNYVSIRPRTTRKKARFTLEFTADSRPRGGVVYPTKWPSGHDAEANGDRIAHKKKMVDSDNRLHYRWPGWLLGSPNKKITYGLSWDPPTSRST